MTAKPLIVLLYGVNLYIIISKWYKAGNSGTPDPKVIGPATYLFALLAVLSSFVDGLPVILALALTVVLWQRANAQGQAPKTGAASAGNQTAKATPANVKKVGTAVGSAANTSTNFLSLGGKG